MKRFKDVSVIFKLGLILVLLIILFFLNVAGIRYFNAKKDVDDYFLSIVEKNSMLINRIGFLSEMVAHGKVERKLDLENTIELLDESLYFLKEGGKVHELKQIIKPSENKNIKNLLDSLTRVWRPYRANVEILLNERFTYSASSFNTQLSDNTIRALPFIENNARKLVSINDILLSEFNQTRLINLTHITYFLAAIILLSIIIGVISIIILNRFIVKPIRLISVKAKEIVEGNESETIKINTDDELGKIANSIHELSDKLVDVATFVSEVGNSNFTATLHSISEDDFLGKALRTMRDNFQEKATDEEKRREEDQQRNWIAAGLAKFAEILRNEGENLERLADNVLSNLIEYMDINQAGLFVLNEAETEKHELDLVAAYAYNRKKYLKKTIALGEGLVGTCALEKETIYRSEIPDDYIQITSGLGGSNPRYLLLVPLKMNDEIFGVIELASFNPIKSHEIEFVESLGESIASTLSSVRINTQTSRLLSQSQEQAEELHSQEEEMRQNIEELQATQEEMLKKEIEMTGLFDAINHSIGMYELSLEGNYIKANNLYLMNIGLSEDELLGKNHYSLAQNNFKNSAEYEAFWNELLAGKHFRKKHLFKAHDREVILKESYTPVRDPDGNITKILVLVNKESGDKILDTTSLKGDTTDEELTKTNNNLKTTQAKLEQNEKLYNDEITKLKGEIDTLMQRETEYQSRIINLEEGATETEEKLSPAPAPAIQEESKLLEWSDKHVLGLDEIDEQHKNLFHIINTLYQAVNEHKTRKQLQSIVKELIDYTQYHFGTEERYFNEFGFKEADIHIDEHQAYIKKITGLYKDIGSKKSKVSYDMMNFIGEWITNHIIHFDKKYTKLFSSKGL